MGERLERIKRPCRSLEYKMAPCLRGMYDLWELAQLSAVSGDLSSLSSVFRLSFFLAVFPLYRRAGLKHGVKTVFMAGQTVRQRLRLLCWCSRVRDRHQTVILICDMEVSFTLYSSVFISRDCCVTGCCGFLFTVRGQGEGKESIVPYLCIIAVAVPWIKSTLHNSNTRAIAHDCKLDLCIFCRKCEGDCQCTSSTVPGCCYAVAKVFWFVARVLCVVAFWKSQKTSYSLSLWYFLASMV